MTVTTPRTARGPGSPASPQPVKARWSRLCGPVPALLVLSPFVAEFLLGDIALTSLPMLLMLIPLYGCGALLIRECARRTGRGWPMILLLALAFGVLEEGLLTQSLFNPDYAGDHLLAAGHLAFLGLGAKWTVHVLTLHVIWSIATPIALVESLWPERRREAWLTGRRLCITSVVFAAGAAATMLSTMAGTSFRPSAAQLSASLAAAVALVAMGFALPAGRRDRPEGPVPPPWVVAIGSLACGSIILTASRVGTVGISLAMYLGTELAALLVIVALSRRAAWRQAHTFALAAGAVIAYAWNAFTNIPVVGSTNPIIDHAGDALFGLAGIVVLAATARRVRRAAPE
jgi:hypothetical protein